MKTHTERAARRFPTDSFWGLALLLFALLLSMQVLFKAQEAKAALIAPGVLRLHILADSSAPADQDVKLEVRSLVLDWLFARQSKVDSKAGALRLLQEQKAALTARIDRKLSALNVPYRSSLTLTRCYFPARVYDGIVFPCGFYDAARVTLGSGRGRNWWCVLYPGLCLTREALDAAAGGDYPDAANPGESTGRAAAADSGRLPGTAFSEKNSPVPAAERPSSVTVTFRLMPELKLQISPHPPAL